MSAWSSGTGNGAVAHSKSGLSSASEAVRHSPSSAIATWPVSNGLAALNSSPKVARNRSSRSYPPSLPTRAFCHRNIAATFGSVAMSDLPSAPK